MAAEGGAAAEEGAAAVLLHGFTGSAEAWGASLLEGLTRAGVDGRALDLPGHGLDAGRSDPAAFTLDTTLAGIDGQTPPVYDMVGYSMGGRIALHQAIRAPGRVRRLVLESASPGLASEEERSLRRRADAELAARILDGGIEAFVDRWEALPLFASQRGLPEEVRRRHRARRLTNDARSLAAALEGLGTGSLPSLWDRLEEVALPTLIVVGALDEKFVEIGRRMAAGMPNARLTVVEGAGHTVHLERPDAWVELVGSFLME